MARGIRGANRYESGAFGRERDGEVPGGRGGDGGRDRVARLGQGATAAGAARCSVGDGRLLPNGTRVRHQVREGDRVLFGRYAGTEMKINGQELLIIGESDILAIVS